MGYNGISPASYTSNLTNVQLIDDISGSFNGSTTTFTLTSNSAPFYSVSARSLFVVLGGIVQKPLVDYTTNGSSITFTIAPVSGLTFAARNIYGLNFLNKPNDGSVVPVSLSTGGPTWNSSGYVGIGTTNPLSALDVRGAITVGVGTVGINSVFSTTDIQSWYYTGKSKNISGDDATPQAIYIGAAGTAMFLVGDSGNDINQYTLSTPYDVSTAGASVGVFSVATQETNPAGIDFNPTGTKMFISGLSGVAPLIASGEYIHEYSLSTAWTVSSAVYTTSYNVTQDTAPQGVIFGNSGSKMYVVGSTGDAVYQYSLSTPYSLASGVTYDNISLVLGTNPILLETTPIDISFNSTGTVLWVAGSANDRIYEFRLGTAWNISTAVFYDDIYIGFNEITPTGLQVIPEQNVAYIIGSNSDTVFQYSTNTPALEIASSGISSESSIVLNNETRVKDKLYVKGLAHFDNNILTQGALQIDGSILVNAGVTFETNANNIFLGTSQTTGTLILGGTTQTGAITLGRATTSQTTNIQAGVTASGNTKTINFGTGGASGSFTQINIGPTTGGTVVVNSGTNLLVGNTTATGTASQPLQVTGGAYISGNVGIGTTNPGTKLHVYQGSGDGVIRLTTAFGTGTEYDLTVGGNGNYSPGVFAIRYSTNGTTPFIIEPTGHVTPGTDATQNLGASNKRWANIYSADLQLSNEGSQNDVDGTWGQYTIQEGENDLFLLNRRNGKKYKFVLQEVN